MSKKLQRNLLEKERKRESSIFLGELLVRMIFGLLFDNFGLF